MRHLDRGGIDHEGRDPALGESFPRLIHLMSFYDGLIAVVRKEEKQVALVEYLSRSSCSLEDGVSVLERSNLKIRVRGSFLLLSLV